MEKLKLMWREFWEERWEYCDRRFWTLAKYAAMIPGSNEQERKMARKLLLKMGAVLRVERFCMKMLGDY